MGKRHYENFHKNEKRIKKCLRCVIREQELIIKNQQEQRTDLEDKLDSKERKIDNLMEEIRNLRHDLREAMDRKEHYKTLYYEHKE